MKRILSILALLAGTAGAQNVSSWTNNVLALSGSAAPLTIQMDLPVRVTFQEYSGPSIYSLADLAIRWQLVDNRDALATATGSGTVLDATNGQGTVATTIRSLEPGAYLLRISAYDDASGEKVSDLALHDVTLTAYCADCPVSSGGGTNIINVSGVTINNTNLIDLSTHNPTTTVYRGGWVNFSTAEYVNIRNGGGMAISNVVSADGRTNDVYVSFGSVSPLVPTNLAGWNRETFSQPLAGGVSGATSITFTITYSNGCDFVLKGFSAGGGYYGGNGALGRFYGTLHSGDVVTLMIPQGGAGKGTNGAWRAFPAGGVCTGNLATVGNGAGAFRFYINGTLIAVVGGGGGGSSAGGGYGGGGGVSGASGAAVGSGTGGTPLAAGVREGGYLQGGDGYAGGAEGIYGGGSAITTAGCGGGGASWWDASIVYGEVVPAIGLTGASPPTSVTGDPDFIAGIATGGALSTRGGNGFGVLYTRAL